MGEITEALRRAGGARRSRRGGRPAPEYPSPSEVDAGSGEPQATEARSAEPEARSAEPASAPRRRSGTPIAERLGRSPAPAPAAEPPDTGITISRERGGTWAARALVVQEHGASAEKYRHFALQVLRALKARDARSLVIASALREEGKTTTACNLALALASMAGGRRIALVDLDLRRPSVAVRLGLRVRAGVERVLDGEADLDDVCIATSRPPLEIFPVREPTANAHEVLARPALGELAAELMRRYDLVVFDSAPILLVPDTGLIFPHVGGCIAVSRARRTRRTSFRQMLEMIPEGKLLGTFLNEVRAPRHSKQYGYYYAGDPESEGGGT